MSYMCAECRQVGCKFRDLTKTMAASPSILAGFVNSLRNTFIMLVYAEMYGAQYGMGYYVKKFADFGMYNKVWLGFVFMVIVMVIVMQLFEKLKDRLLKWTIS